MWVRIRASHHRTLVLVKTRVSKFCPWHLERRAMTHLEDLNILNTLLSPPSNVYFYPLPNDALDIRREESRQCKVMPRVKGDHIASSLNWVRLKERVLALGLFWGGRW